MISSSQHFKNIFSLTLSLFLLLSLTLPSFVQAAQTTAVPSPFCGGGINCAPSLSPLPSGQFMPSPTTTDAVPSGPITPEPTLDPCIGGAVAVTAAANKSKHKKKKQGAVRNSINAFLKLLIEFLNKLLQLLGKGPINLPNPGNPQPTQGIEPTVDPNVPGPSGDPNAFPTNDPNAVPTNDPNAAPTDDPNALPTQDPNAVPTTAPCEPTQGAPTDMPPTDAPTQSAPTAGITQGSPTSAPTSPPSTGLKPQLGGVADRQGGVANTSFAGIVNSFVVEVPWSAVQPNNNNEIAPNNPIDQGIAKAKATGAHIKLRLWTGQYSPAWAKSMTGTINICNIQGSTNHCGTVPKFWQTNFRQAYAKYHQVLAAKYDKVPEIREIDMAGCMTIFEENFLRQPTPSSNITAYQSAGYNEADNQACIKDMINAHKAWTTTRSALAFNPYQKWTGSGFTQDEGFTESMMDYCRQALGSRCVLGNDSIGKSMLVSPGCGGGKGYESMYSKIKCLGKPIYFQTATMTKLGGTSGMMQALTWAIQQGTGMVELPSGYESVGPSALQSPDQQLEANALK